MPHPEPLFDPDTPEWTAEDFALAKPASSLPPAILAAFPRTLDRGDTKSMKVHIGTLDDMGKRIIDAWHRAERGETMPHHDCVTFADWDSLAKVLTSSRLAVLRCLRMQPVASINTLARAMGRDGKQVRADVTALIQAGLIDQQEDGLHADYDRIDIVISLEPGTQ